MQSWLTDFRSQSRTTLTARVPDSALSSRVSLFAVGEAVAAQSQPPPHIASATSDWGLRGLRSNAATNRSTLSTEPSGQDRWNQSLFAGTASFADTQSVALSSRVPNRSASTAWAVDSCTAITAVTPVPKVSSSSDARQTTGQQQYLRQSFSSGPKDGDRTHAFGGAFSNNTGHGSSL